MWVSFGDYSAFWVPGSSAAYSQKCGSVKTTFLLSSETVVGLAAKSISAFSKNLP